MQTFLPYSDFEKSAKSLDDLRLNKQIVEAHQILNALEYGSRWENHPAVKMWKGFENSLREYFNICLLEWLYRGKSHKFELEPIDDTFDTPWWLDVDIFHKSHMSNLLRKNPKYYVNFSYEVSPDWVYLWPSIFPTFRVVIPSWWKKLPEENRPKLNIPESDRYIILK